MEASKPLVASLEAWSKSGVIDTLRRARPIFPDEFSDRQQDISEPLLAIADDAGGEWPSRVRRSLLALFRSEASEDSSLGVTLLRDIRSVFDSRSDIDAGRIFSAVLVHSLTEMEGSPWADREKGREFTATSLAKILKKYHIHPKTIRIGDYTQKGYMRECFSEAWSRYVRDTVEVVVEPVKSVTCQGRSKRKPLGRSEREPVRCAVRRGFSGEKGLWSVAEEALLPRSAFGGAGVNGSGAVFVCGGFA
jgi:hypothetical protein